MGLPLPKPEWGPFKQLTACKAIRRKLRSNAQHVSLVLALETPPDGVIEITHKELHEATERAAETIAAALKEAEAAGLLHGKRTLGTFVYVWAEAAYQAAQDHRRRLFEGLSFADDERPTQDELEGYTLHSYRNAWVKRYRAEKQEVVIEARKLARITQRILLFARTRRVQGETIGAAYRRTCDLCMVVWLSKDGNDGSNWLVERCHALPILADGTRQSPDAELDWVISAVAKKDRNRALEQPVAQASTETPRMPQSNAGIDFRKFAPKSVQNALGVAY